VNARAFAPPLQIAKAGLAGRGDWQVKAHAENFLTKPEWTPRADMGMMAAA